MDIRLATHSSIILPSFSSKVDREVRAVGRGQFLAASEKEKVNAGQIGTRHADCFCGSRSDFVPFGQFDSSSLCDDCPISNLCSTALPFSMFEFVPPFLLKPVE